MPENQMPDNCMHLHDSVGKLKGKLTIVLIGVSGAVALLLMILQSQRNIELSLIDHLAKSDRWIDEIKQNQEDIEDIWQIIDDCCDR